MKNKELFYNITAWKKEILTYLSLQDAYNEREIKHITTQRNIAIILTVLGTVMGVIIGKMM